MMQKSTNGPSRLFAVSIAGMIIIGLMSFGSGSLTYTNKQLLRDTTNWPATFGFGSTATAQEISKWDIAIRADGKGLPPGEGNAAKGEAIYASKCAACHGANGKGIPDIKLPGPVLVGDTAAKSRPKTIGNYWPYATTLYDYVRRAMPYNLPGSLSNDEVYSITAYLLSANKIIKSDMILTAKNLPKIIMPAKKLFVIDDRKGGLEVK